MSCFSALYMLRNVLIVKLAKLYTVNFYVFLSALYMLQYVPIVTILVIVSLFSTKKKMTHTLVWVKIPRLCHNTPLSIFLLGKGGNPYVSKPYIKNKYKCTFCPAPSTKIRFRQSVDNTHQNCPKYVYFLLQISHLSSNRREQNLALYFQFTTPARKLTHTTKFEHFWMQKDMNFGNAMILRHFGPENRQIQPRKTRILGNCTH